jgi:hypothetical protein
VGTILAAMIGPIFFLGHRTFTGSYSRRMRIIGNTGINNTTENVT